MTDFALMLETARLTLKMYQKAFALELGFDPHQYSRWKNGALPNVANREMIKTKIRELLGI